MHITVISRSQSWDKNTDCGTCGISAVQTLLKCQNEYFATANKSLTVVAAGDVLLCMTSTVIYFKLFFIITSQARGA